MSGWRPCAEFEPRQLFNVIQFIMTDREGRGIMTLEEAMQVPLPRAGQAPHKYFESTADVPAATANTLDH